MDRTDAATFASNLEDHYPSRIAIWGDSFFAAEMFLAAACDSRVKAVIGHCPTFGADPPGIDPTLEVFEAIKETFQPGDVSVRPEDKTGPLPLGSSDQMGTPSRENQDAVERAVRCSDEVRGVAGLLAVPAARYRGRDWFEEPALT